MIRIGITGGIGAGKSYICRILHNDYHLPVYDCDAEAKRLNEQSPQIRQALIALLGKDAYQTDGTLNKRLLADYLFASEEHVAQIADIVHPVVADDFRQWTARQEAPLVVMESAILFESHFDKLVDYTININAPLELRISRAAQRDNTQPEAIRKRSAQQLTDEDRCRLAHFTITNQVNQDTDGRDEHLKYQINKILKQLC